jgi:hypothetical protein
VRREKVAFPQLEVLTIKRPLSPRFRRNRSAGLRREADRWAERLRKANLVVEVRGQDGAPLKDARVGYQIKDALA